MNILNSIAVTCLDGTRVEEWIRDGAERLSKALQEALGNVRHCQRCRILCESELCVRCRDERRQQDTICVVEMPSDVLAIEQATHYQGQYFVLSGHLSPLDG